MGIDGGISCKLILLVEVMGGGIVVLARGRASWSPLIDIRPSIVRGAEAIEHFLAFLLLELLDFGKTALRVAELITAVRAGHARGLKHFSRGVTVIIRQGQQWHIMHGGL